MIGESRRPKRPMDKLKASRKPATPFRCRLVVMVKVPQMGRVKTRLAREIGAVQAVRFYRHTVRSVLARIGRDPRWHTELSVAPDTGTASRCWPIGVGTNRQGQGSLGERMQRIFDEAGPGPVIIIGTDIPAIGHTHLAKAFAQLRASDAVLGPTPDGGFWLVGLKRCPRIARPFNGVRWSTADTLTDTACNLRDLTVATADLLLDVDNAADLAQCNAWFGRHTLPKVRA